MQKHINHIQLRAARHALNIGTREMAKILGVAATTLANHERLKFGVKGFNKFIAPHTDRLIQFFADQNIVFPDQYSIEFKVDKDVINNISKKGGQLTRFQIRVARYVLNIGQIEMSKLSGIAYSYINAHENKKNTELLYIYKTEELIEQKYKQWYLDHGIKFISNFKVEFEKHIAHLNKKLL